MLAENFKAIAPETTSVDSFIFESIKKMHYPIT